MPQTMTAADKSNIWMSRWWIKSHLLWWSQQWSLAWQPFLWGVMSPPPDGKICSYMLSPKVTRLRTRTVWLENKTNDCVTEEKWKSTRRQEAYNTEDTCKHILEALQSTLSAGFVILASCPTRNLHTCLFMEAYVVEHVERFGIWIADKKTPLLRTLLKRGRYIWYTAVQNNSNLYICIY